MAIVVWLPFLACGKENTIARDDRRGPSEVAPQHSAIRSAVVVVKTDAAVLVSGEHDDGTRWEGAILRDSTPPPTIAAVVAFEEAIHRGLVAARQRDPAAFEALVGEPFEMKRHYRLETREDGVPRVAAHVFCVSDEAWKERSMGIADGGLCSVVVSWSVPDGAYVWKPNLRRATVLR